MTTQEYDVKTIDKLYAANAALVEALEEITEYADHYVTYYGVQQVIDKARAALKLHKGE